MSKLNSSQPKHSMRATRTDVHQLLGEMDDSKAMAILALHPNISQLEEALVWVNGQGDILGRQDRPLEGTVAEIFDILTIDEEEPPTPRN